MSKKHEEKFDSHDAFMAVTTFIPIFVISLFILVMIVWFLLTLVL